MKLDKADKAFSMWIRSRDDWTCQRCSKQYTPTYNAKGMPTVGASLHCSHFKGRGKEAVRFEPLNADAMCHGCHKYFTAQPDEHVKWQVKTKGQNTVDRVILAASGYKKKDRDLEYQYWKQKLKEDFNIDFKL